MSSQNPSASVHLSNRICLPVPLFPQNFGQDVTRVHVKFQWQKVVGPNGSGSSVCKSHYTRVRAQTFFLFCHSSMTSISTIFFPVGRRSDMSYVLRQHFYFIDSQLVHHLTVLPHKDVMVQVCPRDPSVNFPECVARARVPVSLGVRLCSPKVAFATASVRNRPQP